MNDWTGGTNGDKEGDADEKGEEDESDSSVVNIEDDADLMEANKGTKQPTYALKVTTNLFCAKIELNSWYKKKSWIANLKIHEALCLSSVVFYFISFLQI